MSAISGVWLPIITPFVDGVVDFAGYERLLRHYLSTGITGVFPVGTMYPFGKGLLMLVPGIGSVTGDGG